MKEASVVHLLNLSFYLVTDLWSIETPSSSFQNRRKFKRVMRPCKSLKRIWSTWNAWGIILAAMMPSGTTLSKLSVASSIHFYWTNEDKFSLLVMACKVSLVLDRSHYNKFALKKSNLSNQKRRILASESLSLVYQLLATIQLPLTKKTTCLYGVVQLTAS